MGMYAAARGHTPQTHLDITLTASIQCPHPQLSLPKPLGGVPYTDPSFDSSTDLPTSTCPFLRITMSPLSLPSHNSK
jgi:hypothetical protein